MTNHRTNRAIALSLVLSHLLAFGLHPIFHNASVVPPGSLEQRLVPHEDADHCKHVPISERSDCPICVSHHNSIAPQQDSFGNGQVQIVDKIQVASTLPLSHIDLFGSLSQRGPPSVIL